MFDRTGIPRITDFGVSSMTFNPISSNATSLSHGHSVRWAALEILEASVDSEARRPTKMSDVYAFGMVVVEVGYNLFFVDLRSDLPPLDFYREIPLPRRYRSSSPARVDERKIPFQAG